MIRSDLKIIGQTAVLILLFGIPLSALPYLVDNQSLQIASLVLNSAILSVLIFLMFNRLRYEKLLAIKTSGLMFGFLLILYSLKFVERTGASTEMLKTLLYILAVALFLVAVLPDLILGTKK